MTKGEMEQAIRRAHNNFDRWNDVTGYFEKSTGYYYEILAVIEDAVHCGAQQATKDFKPLDGEIEQPAPDPRVIQPDELREWDEAKEDNEWK
jgi:hypothetical protein